MLTRDYDEIDLRHIYIRLRDSPQANEIYVKVFFILGGFTTNSY
jgi:hypothetical protein